MFVCHKCSNKITLPLNNGSLNRSERFRKSPFITLFITNDCTLNMKDYCISFHCWCSYLLQGDRYIIEIYFIFSVLLLAVTLSICYSTAGAESDTCRAPSRNFLLAVDKSKTKIQQSFTNRWIIQQQDIIRRSNS